VIILVGPAWDPPLRAVRDCLIDMGEQAIVLDQERPAAETNLRLRAVAGQPIGALETDGQTLDLSSVSAIYNRIVDFHILDAYRNASEEERSRRDVLSQTLFDWLEVTRDALVVNRFEPQGSNSCKMYQSKLLAEVGFRVPSTLVTNDVDAARAFLASHPSVIVKSASGARSVTHRVLRDEWARLDLIRHCPVQLQEEIFGTDLRVHVIGDGLIATVIETDAVDYRYPGDLSRQARATQLEPRVAALCREATECMGLVIAGLDLKIDPAGNVYCFEINPSPGFTFFERLTGQPISLTVARLLAARD
jgi:glutathione synthase/RimK-type ligase-like ATP-grasp enzyme